MQFLKSHLRYVGLCASKKKKTNFLFFVYSLCLSSLIENVFEFTLNILCIQFVYVVPLFPIFRIYRAPKLTERTVLYNKPKILSGLICFCFVFYSFFGFNSYSTNRKTKTCLVKTIHFIATDF